MFQWSWPTLENVLTVPNAALRFKPVPQPAEAPEQKSPGEPVSSSQTGGPREQPGAEKDGGQGALTRTIWVLDANRRLESRSVKVGITNGRVTAINDSDLHDGDVVVIGQNDGGRRTI
jgi:HlyD family secretion protein